MVRVGITCNPLCPCKRHLSRRQCEARPRLGCYSREPVNLQPPGAKGRKGSSCNRHCVAPRPQNTSCWSLYRGSVAPAVIGGRVAGAHVYSPTPFPQALEH